MATLVLRTREANCISGDAVIKASAGAVFAVVLSAGSAADASLILYDNATAAAGERELVLTALAKTSEAFTPAVGMLFNSGIYADITGAGAYATIIFE